MLFILAAVVFLWWRSSLAPAWYQPPDPQLAQNVQQADRFEYGVVVQAQKVRAVSEHWSVTLTENDINTWLSSRLPEWLAHEYGQAWPAELGPPQVNLGSGQVEVALDLGPKTGGRVLVVRLEPELNEEGFQFQTTRLSLGRIPLGGDPAQKLLELLEEVAPETTAKQESIQPVLDILLGRAVLEPEFTLADGRRVIVHDLTLADEHITLTNQTVGREQDE